MNKEIRSNIITWLILLGIAAIGIFYGNQIKVFHPGLRIWNFNNLLILLAGIPFLFFQRQAEIPDFWQKEISNRNRLAIPFLLGLVFGCLDILVFKVILHPEPYNELPPFLQPFPYSIFLYISGAFEIETFYRLIPITILCFIGRRFQKGRFEKQFFIFAVILTSLREPIEQFSDGALWLIIYSLGSCFIMNMFQALTYRKNGFPAALSLRLGHYVLWHILLGVYVEFVEIV